MLAITAIVITAENIKAIKKFTFTNFLYLLIDGKDIKIDIKKDSDFNPIKYFYRKSFPGYVYSAYKKAPQITGL
jgi:hypothetical protein